MRREAIEALGSLGEADRRRVLAELTAAEKQAFESDWPRWAHVGQRPPEGDDWRVWVLQAGRGFGKTRAGAEWVLGFVRAHPGAAVALIAATAEEARAVMVEGRSGLLALMKPHEREEACWHPSRRRLLFANGAEAFLYSAANPESLRGPEHHIGWCDELAKWTRAQEAWDNFRLGLRLGEKPRALVTTTPRSVKALTGLLALDGTVRTGGATRANPHLPDDFIAAVEAAHAGTRFGRQELDGVLVEDVEGALWTRATIERARVHWDSHFQRGGAGSRAAWRESDCPLVRVVIGVDPPASPEGRCGIVVCGLGADGLGYVLADASVGGVSPEGWSRRVAEAAEAWVADRVVAEKNNGGAMVESVLRAAHGALPVTLVHAAEGKVARAEPVAFRFEKGEAKLAGVFPELEDELAGLVYGGGYEGPGDSPDRADAMVWALTELMVKRQRAAPRVTAL